jgi:hypothetical protein
MLQQTSHLHIHELDDAALKINAVLDSQAHEMVV